MDYFGRLTEKPRDPILGIGALFLQDPNPKKVNLGIGAYKSEDGQVTLLKSVHQAEHHLWEEKRSKSYSPIDGDKTFRDEVLNLIYETWTPQTHYAAQTVGCTAALRVSGEILREMGIQTIYIPDLTWPNHFLIYASAGLETRPYPYYDHESNHLSLEKMLHVFKEAPKNSAVLLQVGCHNPVGRDPTKEEWETITDLLKEKNLFPILDCAYQGFGESFFEDGHPIRLFDAKFQQSFLCYSFSKNFALYGERTGAFVAIDHSKKYLEILSSNAKQSIRSIYSTPPIHGARIVKTILQSQELKEIWMGEIFEMQKRLVSLRLHFVEALKAQGIKKDYRYIQVDRGLFSLMGLTEKQVIKLRDEYSVYLVENGRLNIAALSLQNMGYVAESIKHILLSDA